MRDLLERMADTVADRLAALPEGFDDRKEVGQGASGSATSSIDMVAEQAVLELVRDEGAELNILSEEIGFVDNGADMTLVVDPLDGTANYHARIPFYSVSLAVGNGRMSDVTHGLVRNLVSGETYYAEKGKGAWLDGVRLATRRLVPENSLFLAYVGNATDPRTFGLFDKVRRVRALGCASLEMCHVARGMADGFYFRCTDFSRMMRVVDIAASALVLREARGELFAFGGELLDLGFSLDDRGCFAALGDPSCRGLIL